jgi:hypothetical protein
MPSPGVPIVVAVEMGLGHLRAGAAVADALGQPLLQADRDPLADEAEQRIWRRTRRWYEGLTRLSQLRVVGPPLRALVGGITHIPHLHPGRDLSAPTMSTRFLDRLVRRGLGRGVVDVLQRDGMPLFSTFFATALAADHHGCPNVSCLVTDTDAARAWVASDPARSRIRYLAPSDRVVRRLRAYGVPSDRIQLTGFPLPHELVGGPELGVLRRNLVRRIGHLDPGAVFRDSHREELERRLGGTPVPDGAAPLLVFAVGGAGAQAELPEQFLPSLRDAIIAGRLRLALMAGTRVAVAERFRELFRRHGLGGHAGALVVVEPELGAYFKVCNALLGEADILWTKPSEMTFYGALGLPLVLSAPVGAQEVANRRWAVEQGAGLAQRDPRYAGEWIREWLENGTLAGAAWSGFTRLPKRGLYRILQAYGVSAAAAGAARSRAAPAGGSNATLSTGS